MNTNIHAENEDIFIGGDSLLKLQNDIALNKIKFDDNNRTQSLIEL